MRAFFPEFDKDWVKMIPSEKIDPNTVIGMMQYPKPRNLFTEQTEAFFEFMSDTLSYLNHHEKQKKLIGRKFKEMMGTIDPIGIVDEYWEDMIIYSKISNEIEKERAIRALKVNLGEVKH
jgi:hypothetical protein